MKNNINSIYIARYLEKRHHHVLTNIRKWIKEEDNDLFTNENIVISNYIDKLGIKRESYLLNQNQCIFLIMSSSGYIASKFKKTLIESFSEEEMKYIFNKFSENVDISENMYRLLIE